MIKDGRVFVAKCFAGNGFFQFGDGPDVAGAKLPDFGQLLALNDQGVLEAFRVLRL